MIQIQAYNVSQEPNSSLYSLCFFVSELIRKHIDAREWAIFEPFMQAVTAFKAELDQQICRYGEQIREADDATDRIWAGLNHYLKAHALHYQPEIQALARPAIAIFQQFECPVRMPYKKAYGIYDRLLSAMRDLPSETRSAIGLDGWLDALDHQIQSFLNLQRAQLSQKKEQLQAPLIAAREALIQAYNEMILQLNARILVFQQQSLCDLAGEMIHYFDDLRAMVKSSATKKRRAARKKASMDAQKPESGA